MKTIWKYDLSKGYLIQMPRGAEILTVQVQDDSPMLWALVDPTAEKEPRQFAIYGTGHDINEEGKYIGTFQMKGGIFVFHVFELGLSIQ